MAATPLNLVRQYHQTLGSAPTGAVVDRTATIAPTQPNAGTRFDHAFAPGRWITSRRTMAWRIASFGDPRRHRRQFWQNEILLFTQAKSVPCRGVSELLRWSGPARRWGCQSAVPTAVPRLTCKRAASFSVAPKRRIVSQFASTRRLLHDSSAPA